MCTATNNATAASTAAQSQAAATATKTSFWKNPQLWKGVGSAAAISGGIISGTGQYIAGRAEQAAYNAQATSLLSGAELTQAAAQRQVKYDLQVAAENVKQVRRAGRQAYGKQLVAAAANGTDFSSVSLQDAMLDSLRAEQEDINLIKRTASQRAYETQLQADLNSIEAESQAAQARIAGRLARKTARLNTYGTLLSSAGMVAGMWSK